MSGSSSTTTTATTSATRDGGMRTFAFKVMHEVKRQQKTNYSSVADALVISFNRESKNSLNDTQKKNIRRRVYDALNVLSAMGVLLKVKKDIVWIGEPSKRPGYILMDNGVDLKASEAVAVAKKHALSGKSGKSAAKGSGGGRDDDEEEEEEDDDEDDDNEAEGDEHFDAASSRAPAAAFSPYTSTAPTTVSAMSSPTSVSASSYTTLSQSSLSPNVVRSLLSAADNGDMTAPAAAAAAAAAASASSSSSILSKSNRIRSIDNDLDGDDGVLYETIDVVRKRVNLKRRHLHDLLQQQLWYRSLLKRNMSDLSIVTDPNLGRLALPFLIINTSQSTLIRCEVAEDCSEFSLEFSGEFEIHDDNDVLKQMADSMLLRSLTTLPHLLASASALLSSTGTAAVAATATSAASNNSKKKKKKSNDDDDDDDNDDDDNDAEYTEAKKKRKKASDESAAAALSTTRKRPTRKRNK